MNVYIYTMILLVIGFLWDVFKKKKNLIYILFYIGVSAYLIYLTGFRYGIDTDFYSYREIYYNYSYMYRMQSLEIGYVILCYFFNTVLNYPFEYFIFSIALFSFGYKLLKISRLKNPFIGLLIYVSNFMIILEWNAIRQGIAISFLIAASDMYFKGKKKTYILLVFVASLFHFSALFFLILPLISKLKFDYKKLCMLVAAVLVIHLFAVQPLLEIILSLLKFFPNVGFIRRMITYLNEYEHITISFGILKRIIMIFILYIFNQKSHDNDYYFSTSLLGKSIFIIFVGVNVVTSRVPLLFEVYDMNILSNTELEASPKNLWKFSILLLMLVIIFFNTLYASDSIPYQSIFIK